MLTMSSLARSIRRRLFACLAALLVLVLGGVASLPLAWASDAVRVVVGEAATVIGQVRITRADGSALDAQRGATVQVGDRIETQAGAHVHIRFVDGALVSLRPSSRLVVDQYATQSAEAGGTAIKFRLEEGVVRSITGAWGAASRERFRLNTPLAAIGVKGTDFVVRTSGAATVASVFTGAIVLAPLTGDCVATLGPCANGLEKLLTAEMKGQMLELLRDQATPRLVPAIDLLAIARSTAFSTGVTASALGASTGVAASSPSAAAPTSGAGLSGSLSGASSGIETFRGDPARLDTRLERPTLVQVVPSADVLAAAAAVIAAAERNSPKQDLFWVSYPWAATLAGDNFTRRFDAALMQSSVGLAFDGAFSLRRPEATVFVPRDATASFRLTGGAASVARDLGRETEPVQITNGSLSVDFSKSSFSTEITTTGPKLGTAVVQAVGRVDALGGMQSASGNANVVGGLNGDGYKAGLAFRRDVPGGTLLGVTLWGR